MEHLITYPDELDESHNPAWLTTDDGETRFIAHHRVLSSGWVQTIGWDGTPAKLPPHRVDHITEAETERFEVDHTPFDGTRLADEEAFEEAERLAANAEAKLMGDDA